MDRSNHTLACLFAQLGLANNNDDIESFINKHAGIPQQTSIAQASLWNKAQAQFLKDALEQDSDWSEIVDMLDSLLRIAP